MTFGLLIKSLYCMNWTSRYFFCLTSCVFVFFFFLDVWKGFFQYFLTFFYLYLNSIWIFWMTYEGKLLVSSPVEHLIKIAWSVRCTEGTRGVRSGCGGFFRFVCQRKSFSKSWFETVFEQQYFTLVNDIRYT